MAQVSFKDRLLKESSEPAGEAGQTKGRRRWRAWFQPDSATLAGGYRRTAAQPDPRWGSWACMFPHLSLTAQALSRASSPPRGFWSSVWALIAQEFFYEEESKVQSVGSKSADTLRDSRGSGWLTDSFHGRPRQQLHTVTGNLKLTVQCDICKNWRKQKLILNQEISSTLPWAH